MTRLIETDVEAKRDNRNTGYRKKKNNILGCQHLNDRKGRYRRITKQCRNERFVATS